MTISVYIPQIESWIDVDEAKLPDNIFKIVLEIGLRHELSRRLHKIGTLSKLKGDDLAHAKNYGKKIVEANLDRLYSGVSGRVRPTENRIPRETFTIAMRIAKELVKNELRSQGYKIAFVGSTEIRRLALTIVNSPEIIAEAEHQLNFQLPGKITIIPKPSRPADQNSKKFRLTTPEKSGIV